MNKSEENRVLNALKRSARTIIRINKEIDSLRAARERMSGGSPEYYLLGEAIGDLSSAASHLHIVVRRCNDKLTTLHDIHPQDQEKAEKEDSRGAS